MNNVTDREEKMPKEEFITHALRDMMDGWVPIEVYFAMFPTETKGAITMRLKRGQWFKRVHYYKPPGAMPWVNLIEIRKWASGKLEVDDGRKRLRCGALADSGDSEGQQDGVPAT